VRFQKLKLIELELRIDTGTSSNRKKG